MRKSSTLRQLAGKLRTLHTLALLWRKRQVLGPFWWVASAADAGAGATVGGACHLTAYRRALSEGGERGGLSPVMVSVLPGIEEELVTYYDFNAPNIQCHSEWKIISF